MIHEFKAPADLKEDKLVCQARKGTADYIKRLRGQGVPNYIIQVLAIEHHAMEAIKVLKLLAGMVK